PWASELKLGKFRTVKGLDYDAWFAKDKIEDRHLPYKSPDGLREIVYNGDRYTAVIEKTVNWQDFNELFAFPMKEATYVGTAPFGFLDNDTIIFVAFKMNKH